MALSFLERELLIIFHVIILIYINLNENIISQFKPKNGRFDMEDNLTPKYLMTEEDIKANYITPAILLKGWKNGTDILYEFFFTDERIEVHGERATRNKQKYTDYLLYYKKRFSLSSS